jgi:putative chitinase
MTDLTAAAAITPLRLRMLAARCDAQALAPVLDAACARHGIDTPARVRNFLAQLSVESWGFTRLEEDLDYSDPKRLMALFAHKIPALSLAQGLVHQPEKLANLIYGGRFGNSEPGDGWRYRGRGFIGITFKDNYAAASPHAGVDLVADPDQLAVPAIAAETAASWWSVRGLNDLADRGDVLAISHEVNGGANGLSDREAVLKTAQLIWPG